jgi:guanylate kinase
MPVNTQQKIIILTAPSGAGKTSITRYLLKKFPNDLAFSISAATRPPRGLEKNAVDYYFISEEEFTNKIQHEEFLEWEMVYEGKYYGTLKSELQRIWNDNKIPLLDIDVKGAIHVQQQYPETTLAIFIEPPSIDELKARLTHRGTENEDSLNVIVNTDLAKACAEAEFMVYEFIK